MSSPILWGPNSIANNLQNSVLNANGQLLAFNGQKNYLTNPLAELGTTSGWSLGAVTLTSNLPTGTPTFGSGASGNLTLTATSTTPLSGLYSFSYASSAATTAGNFIASDAFTVDSADLGKVLAVQFYYKATSNPGNANWSGTTSNSFSIAIYDVTAGAANWIIPVGNQSMIQSSGVGIATASFQSSVVSGQQYRIVVYNANATSGAITLYLDQLFVGPSPQAQAGGVVSFSGTNASQSVTANVTNFALTTTKDSSAAWNGTQYVVPIAGDYFVGGGCILSAATAIGAYVNGSLVTFGSSAFTNGASAVMSAVLTGLKPGDLISIRCGGTCTVTSSQFGIFLISSQPGVGAGGVVAASYWASANRSTSPTTPVNFDSKEFDTAGAVTTGAGWIFTAPITGLYQVNVYGQYTAGANSSAVVYKNGTAYKTVTSENANYNFSPGTTLISANAGDTIQIRTDGSVTWVGGASLATPGISNISIFLVQGSSQASGSLPSINARYFASATSISGSLATVVWTTKDFDTAAGMSSGVYTIPITGKYQINSAVATTGTFALNNQLIIEIQKNSTVVSRDKNYAGGIITDLTAAISDIISCNAGDTIRIQLSSGATVPSIVSSNFENYFSLSLVGY